MPIRDRDSDYWVCPHCGTELPPHATFCPECGASEESGWTESEEWGEPDSSDVDDSDFDYDEFIAREFPDHADRHPSRRSPIWFLFAAIALLLIVLLVLGTVF